MKPLSQHIQESFKEAEEVQESILDNKIGKPNKNTYTTNSKEDVAESTESTEVVENLDEGSKENLVDSTESSTEKENPSE